jgi:hypothetical protein
MLIVVQELPSLEVGKNSYIVNFYATQSIIYYSIILCVYFASPRIDIG